MNRPSSSPIVAKNSSSEMPIRISGMTSGTEISAEWKRCRRPE